MLDFMVARGIPAGTLAVSKGGKLLLSRGYGWADPGRTQVVAPDALMRIASNDKPIASAAIKRLVSQGKLALSTPVFAFLNITPPAGQTPDPRLKDITIAHLLDHSGGWDIAQLGYDPVFSVVDIANSLSIPSPAQLPDVARYMAGQPLQFTPGERSAYSNLGYALLRLTVERVSGKSFVAYARDEFGMDIDRSHAFPAERNPREIWYSDPNSCTNVYAPPASVPCPDGGLLVDQNFTVATAPALIRFLNAHWISGEPRAPGQNGYTYWFFGSLPGTFSLTYQRPDGVDIAVLFNQRQDPSGLPYDTIKDVMEAAANSVAAWPTQ
jgi:CubicO group peptidase (beta-lactamase class C family)